MAPGPAPANADREAWLRGRYRAAPALAVLTGAAAYYHDSLAGRPTASGEPYYPTDFTAAHRTLPFGTILRVTPSAGGPNVHVRVTDRGPFGEARRIIDLSRAAAERLGMLQAGVIPVVVEVLAYGSR
jgi:rare lipoprotein A